MHNTSTATKNASVFGHSPKFAYNFYHTEIGKFNRGEPSAVQRKGNVLYVQLPRKTNDDPTTGVELIKTKWKDTGNPGAEIIAHRLKLKEAGYHPIPVDGKKPAIGEWQKQTNASEEDIKGWDPRVIGFNTGLLTKDTPGFDGDILDAAAATAVEELARKKFAGRGCILTRIGLAPKFLIPFRTKTPFKNISVPLTSPGIDKEQKLEFLCDGQQFVAFGMHPDTHKQYQWGGGGEPGPVRHDQLPLINEDEARAFIEEAVELLVQDFGYQRAAAPKKAKGKVNGGDDPYARRGANKNKNTALSDAALANLAAWVPEIFPAAWAYKETGFRVSSPDRGPGDVCHCCGRQWHEHQEDLSFDPTEGICDFAVADEGDPKGGSRTPIEIVMEHVFFVPAEDLAKHERTPEFEQAFEWLRERVLPDTGKKKAGPYIDDLNDMIINGCSDRFKGDRSKAVWSVIMGMLRRGHLIETIEQVLLDRDNGISDHIYDQSDPRKYAERQVAQAVEDIDFSRDDEGHPYSTANNIRIALLKMGITLRYDQFADRILIDGLYGFGPVLEDAAVNRFWLSVDRDFHFRPAIEFFYTVLQDTARLNSFHPVCDYLDALQWDGKPRLDGWLTAYADAADNEYTRAVGTLMLIAGVRRVRQPGCKFDEMCVLEQPQQGTAKSTALAVLAVNDEWFSDDIPLNASGKEVIEMIRGRWILEAAELSGMGKADVEHLKAMLSRRYDRGRMAYGRLPIEAPRQCIIFGSTNKTEYLRDTTGNRRYWPVLIQEFDLDALRRDRDQLWAEAAAREAMGESIRLRRELWPEAAKEQKQRLADDPFVAVLDKYLGTLEGKIKAADVWEILGLHGTQLTQEAYARSAEAMKRIGWERPNKAGTAKFNGKMQTAFVRGSSTVHGRREITVTRFQGAISVGWYEEGVDVDGRKTRTFHSFDGAGEEPGLKMTSTSSNGQFADRRDG